MKKPVSSSLYLTMDPHNKFAGSSVVCLVIDDIADHVFPFRKLRAWFWASEHHAGLKRQRVESGWDGGWAGWAFHLCRDFVFILK